MKDIEGFHKMVHRGKGGNKGLKQQQTEGQQANLIKFQVLEEEEQTKK